MICENIQTIQSKPVYLEKRMIFRNRNKFLSSTSLIAFRETWIYINIRSLVITLCVCVPLVSRWFKIILAVVVTSRGRWNIRNWTRQSFAITANYYKDTVVHITDCWSINKSVSSVQACDWKQSAKLPRCFCVLVCCVTSYCLLIVSPCDRFFRR